VPPCLSDVPLRFQVGEPSLCVSDPHLIGWQVGDQLATELERAEPGAVRLSGAVGPVAAVRLDPLRRDIYHLAV
jgi:hypothetical protein